MSAHAETSGHSAAASPPTLVVAGHICLDLIPALPPRLDLTPNSLTRIGPAVIATGGCVANVGLALHRLGMPVRLVAMIGDDPLGRLLADQLRAIEPSLPASLKIASGETTSYSIVLAPPGKDRLFWHCPGANDAFKPNDVPDAALAGTAWLHVGYPPVMRQWMIDAGEACAALLHRAHKMRLKTSLDFCSIDPASEAGRVDWPRWLARVLPHVDLLVPSFDEMAVALGIKDTALNKESVRRVAGQLLALGAGAVALKLGDRGLYYRDPAVECYQPCFAINLAGATGAGDCTIAGLIAGLARGMPLADAIPLALGAGACCCEQPDATSGVSPIPLIQRRIAAGWKRKSPPLF